MPRHPLSTTVKFKRLHDDVQLPERKSEDAAGMDIYAYLPDGKIGIPPGERKLIPTGFALLLDDAYEPSLSDVWMGPSVEGFRLGNHNELEILIRNLSPTTLILEPSVSIAVLRFLPVVRTNIEVC